MPPATVRIDAENPIGTVFPRLYGHFAEHLDGAATTASGSVVTLTVG